MFLKFISIGSFFLSLPQSTCRNAPNPEQMATNILLFLSLLGGIALCLYGMKVMSQGLMQITGSGLRAMLRGLSQHSLHGLGLGWLITLLIQSSSAMTVMTVGLVNAGMLSLYQSFAIIMGANVGTTITAWYIAVFGYHFHLGWVAVPMVLLAFPFSYCRRLKLKTWGDIILGMGLMLYGFCFFIDQMPSATQYPQIVQLLSTLTALSFGSVLLFVVLGVLLTMLLQSSAATIMLAMVLCSSGWLPLVMAMALVVGDNVGTTLNALLASRKTNVSARRASWSHLGFNLVGMVWALVFIYPIATFLQGSIGVTAESCAYSIALFHTLFNLITALLLLPLAHVFCKMLCGMLPENKADDEEFHLSFIQSGLLATAEFSVEEARKESVLFGERCQRMLMLTQQFINMPQRGDGFSHAFSRIEKYEKITDRLELEIVRYLNSMDKSNISERVAARIRSLYKVVDELESIGDSCYNLARAVLRRRDAGVSFLKMQQNGIDRMLAESVYFMEMMVQIMHKNELSASDLIRVYNQEDSVNSLRNQLRDQNISNVQNGYYTYQSGVLYMDIVSGCEKLCDYMVNVLEALAEQYNIPAREDDDVAAEMD